MFIVSCFAPPWGTNDSHENAVLGGGSRSVATLMTATSSIFIGGGEPEKVMRYFYDNASFGSHDKPLLVCRGLLTTGEKPTMNSEYEFIVATPAIFSGVGAPNGRKNNFHEGGPKWP